VYRRFLIVTPNWKKYFCSSYPQEAWLGVASAMMRKGFPDFGRIHAESFLLWCSWQVRRGCHFAIAPDYRYVIVAQIV
jgi:hypothetical protein